MDFKDYYEILAVDRDADKAEIKRAYRKMARKYHPDVSKEANAEDKFKEVNEAYEVLSDPEKRAAYDQYGEHWQQAGQQPPPGWDEGFEFNTGGYTSGNAEDFSEFFENIFGQRGDFRGGSRGRSPFDMPGSDQHAKIQIDLEDAYKGTQQTIILNRTEMDAQGRAMLKEQKLNVKIPKGVAAGQSIRLAGQGNAGMQGGKAGDLFLEVNFKPHSRYQVEGKDVSMTLPIAPWEAALGAKITVPLPDSKVDVTVPKGAKAGQKMRLKGKGIPAKQPGDFYVILHIVAPPVANDAVESAYRELEKAANFNPREALGV